MEQSVLYTHSKGEINVLMSQNEIEVFPGILILSGFCSVSSRRLYWKNDSVCQNTAVYNVVRRNRYNNTVQYVHFADNFV